MTTPTSPLRPRGRHQPLKEGSTVFAQLRVRRGLSQRDVARLTGLSKGVISEIESGARNPRPDQVKALLDLYDRA